MKKKFLNLFFVLVLMIPLVFLLVGCSVGKVTYTSAMPNIYEADLEIRDADGNLNTQYSVIKRYETVGAQKYLFFYGKYEDLEHNRTEEWLGVWNDITAKWSYYRWSADDNEWHSDEVGTTFSMVRSVATYMNGVILNKIDLVYELDDYLEYTWGGKYPDTIRISNNVYHVCLYHRYNNKGETIRTEKFTKFIFDDSTTPIPHFQQFNFND